MLLVSLSFHWYCRDSLLRCDNWEIDLDEHTHSRINQSIATDNRTFWPCTPSSTAYKTHISRICSSKSTLHPVIISLKIPEQNTQQGLRHAPCYLSCSASSSLKCSADLWDTVGYTLAMWAWRTQTVTLQEAVKDWPLRDVGINLRSFFCSGLILSARSSDARHRSKPFTSPAKTYTHNTQHIEYTTHNMQITIYTTCDMRCTKHTNPQHVHTSKCWSSHRKKSPWARLPYCLKNKGHSGIQCRHTYRLNVSIWQVDSVSWSSHCTLSMSSAPPTVSAPAPFAASAVAPCMEGARTDELIHSSVNQ